MTLLLFIIYSIELILFERICNRDVKGFRISISNFFFIALVAYTILPISDCMIKNKDTEYVASFLLKCIILLAVMVFGYYLGDRSSRRVVFIQSEYKISSLSISQQRFWSIFWALIVIGMVALNVVINRGGISNALGASYRESYITVNNNIGALLYASMPYVMIFSDNQIITDKVTRKIVTLIAIVLIGLNFLLGNRNIAIMIALAWIWTVFKDRTYRKGLIYGGAIIGIVALGFIAVMREFSILNVLKGGADINWSLAKEYAFSFSNGELGTTFAFEKYQHAIVNGFDFPYKFGYSYFILPLLNIIPSSIWSSKPTPYADYFSQYAFGGFDGTGYGFSPIYEAEVNYGILWWIVFLVIGFVLARFNKINANQKQKYYNVGLIACIVLNFFRIDFSTCFKFFAMMWVFKWFYLFSFRLVLGTANIIMEESDR